MGNEKELEEMEKRCEATKAARQSLEAANEKLDLELMDARAQLAKIQEGKEGFETKLVEAEAAIEAKRVSMKDGEKTFNREKEIEERKMKEGLDDLGVMEFNVTSLQA